MAVYVCALLMISLLLQAAGAAEDRLGNLPAPWGHLLPVPQQATQAGLDDDAMGNIAEARANVDRSLDDKDIPAAELGLRYGTLGSFYLRYNVFSLADLCFDNALKLDPENFRWAYLLAYVAQKSGRPELALQRYQAASKLDDYPTVQIRIAEINLNLNRPEAAESAYTQALKVPELRAPAEFGLGQIALLRRNYSQSVRHFEQALALDPDALQAHYPLAQALRALKQTDKAREHLKQHGKGLPKVKDPILGNVKKLGDSAFKYFNQAIGAVHQQDYPNAIAAFEEGLRKQPDNAYARISYARVLYLQEADPARARAELEKALAADKDNALGYFLLGILDDAGRQPDAAISHYRQTLAIDPEHAGAHYYLANSLLHKQEYQQALPHYEKTLQLEPKNLNAYLMYLSSLELVGADDKLLLEKLDAAMTRFADNPLLQVYLIRLLALSPDPQVRNPEKSLELARSLVNRQAIQPHMEVLALSYAANGDFESAILLQEQLVTLSSLQPMMQDNSLSYVLSLYKNAQLPGVDRWFATQATPVNASEIFRYYPSAKPF